MAFSNKSSPSVVLVVLILIVSQPVYSQLPPPESSTSQPESPPPPSTSRCKIGCFMRCIAQIISPTFIPCVGACLIGVCGTQTKTLSNPSFHCGVGCVRSKCSDPGAEYGNVNEGCVSSCVGGCDASFVGDVY